MSDYELIRKNATAVEQTGQAPMFTEAEFEGALMERAAKLASETGSSVGELLTEASKGRGDDALIALTKVLYPARIEDIRRAKVAFEKRFIGKYLL